MKLKVTLKGKPFVPDSDSYGDGLQWRRGPLLGKGGFASVFLAVPRASQPPSKYMAVKSARISDANSLKEEHQVLAALVDCPNVIHCFGEETTTGGDGTVAYNLLLEYGSGGSLRDRISKAASGGGGGLPEPEVRRYTRCILQGLASIHQVGYVHCDLKPDNVLLVWSGEEAVAKVCDFGLAKRAGAAAERHWRGTAMYSSPEAVKYGVQESPSDVWALGCIVLEMLTGKAVWEVEDGDDEDYDFEESILKQIGKGCVPKIPKHLSHDARTFLSCCLRRMVKNRLPAKTLLRHPFVHARDLSSS